MINTRCRLKRIRPHRLALAGIAAIALCLPVSAVHAVPANGDQVLVEIAGNRITVTELEQTLASSPFAVQFNTLDRDQQAAMRGMMLKRLVAAHLMRLEARSSGLADTDSFKKDVAAFRKGLLYRRYMDALRARVELPADELNELQQQFKDSPDAFTAAKSAALTERYRAMRVLVLQQLRNVHHVEVYEDRIKPGLKSDTVLLKGNNIRIRYDDLTAGHNPGKQPDSAWIKERLYQTAELELIADAAEIYGRDVEAEVSEYIDERLPATLREQLENKWIKTDDTLRTYFKQHQEIGAIPARWHIGQVVVKTRKEAERLRSSILKGASLFRIAGSYSIDPYGKSHNGDMGWLRQGTGYPPIEAAVTRLNKGEISDIVETPKGFHILTVLDKRDGEQLSFEAVRAKVRQTLVEERLVEYLAGLQQKYDVKWNVLEQKAAAGNGKS